METKGGRSGIFILVLGRGIEGEAWLIMTKVFTDAWIWTVVGFKIKQASIVYVYKHMCVCVYVCMCV